MASNATRESAKIYQFVPKARVMSGAARGAGRPEPVRRHFPAVECGSGWYHDAAIREDERPRSS